jgi:enolase-phosphatase E1
MRVERVSAVLLDIEGTTTALDFVHGVLFPFAASRLTGWIVEHGAEERVRSCVERVCAAAEAEGVRASSDADVGEVLRRWIAQDRKHPALKQLQGFVWRAGYESGAFRGHLYPEVPGCLETWRASGLILAIYSSGSVESQRLLFQHSNAGDLTGLISRYFDATIGGKRDPLAYASIAVELGICPGEILFLSDVQEELDAARAGGLRTMQLVRDGVTPGTAHPQARDFLQVERTLNLAARSR